MYIYILYIYMHTHTKTYTNRMSWPNCPRTVADPTLLGQAPRARCKSGSTPTGFEWADWGWAGWARGQPMPWISVPWQDPRWDDLEDSLDLAVRIRWFNIMWSTASQCLMFDDVWWCFIDEEVLSKIRFSQVLSHKMALVYVIARWQSASGGLGGLEMLGFYHDLYGFWPIDMGNSGDMNDQWSVDDWFGDFPLAGMWQSKKIRESRSTSFWRDDTGFWHCSNANVNDM